MKFLDKFNIFKSKNKTIKPKLYEPIVGRENIIPMIDDSKSVEMDISTINKISNLNWLPQYGKKNIKKEPPTNNGYFKNDSRKYKVTWNDKNGYNFGQVLEILEADDEWYYVEWLFDHDKKTGHRDSTFKCDQFDGLIQCLKDNKFIK